MSAIPHVIAYQTPPKLRPQRLPWDLAAIAWAHIALGGAMVLLARPYVYRGQLGGLLTIWVVTMIIAPVGAGGAVILGRRHFLARLAAALSLIPLMAAEVVLTLYGLLLVVLGPFSRQPNLLTIGIAVVAVAALLLWLTSRLLRYIATPCDPPTAILPAS